MVRYLYFLSIVFVLLLGVGCEKSALQSPGEPVVQGQEPTLEYYQSRASEIVMVDLPTLAELVQKHLQENPQMTASQLRETLFNDLKLLKKQVDAGQIPLEKVASASLSLCPEEWWLLYWNSLYVPPTRKASDDATAEAQRQWPGDQYQTKADAFRHSYWNILLAKRINLSWAEKYTNAHESCHPNNLDKAMDLHNNLIGRQIYMGNSSKSEAALSNIVKSAPYVFVTSSSQMNISALVYIRK